MASDLQDALHFAQSLLDKTRPLILQKIQDGFNVELKVDQTVVTEIDREVETFLKQEILARFPSHGVLGEEYGALNPSSDYLWIIDPIDGTQAVVDGSKNYGTLLALKYQQETVLGLIDHPAYGLRYYAIKDEGVSCNGNKLTLTSQTRQAPIAVCRKDQFERYGDLATFQKIWGKVKNVQEFSDCYGHTRVLEGAFDAMIDYNLNSWDFEATRILIDEAGGKFRIHDTKTKADGTKVHSIIFGKADVVDWLSKEIV